MLELEIIQNVDSKKTFHLMDLYQFYFDAKNVADNMYRRWSGDVRDASETSQNLLMMANELYERAITSDENEECDIIDVEAALKSNSFQTYLNAVCEL